MTRTLLPMAVLPVLLLGSHTGSFEHQARATNRRADATLWYRQPAREWVEALPVGNGRLGAMVFGGMRQETIQLNEDTVWSRGDTVPRLPPSVASELPAIRQLFFDGKYAEGEARVRQTMLAVPNGGGSYQTLGDLLLTDERAADGSGYRRSLDLDSGIAGTTFASGGVTYTREV